MRRLALALALLAGSLLTAEGQVRMRTGSSYASTGAVRLTDNGGRVAVYNVAGGAHSQIAFDAIAATPSQNTELYVMEMDGTGRTCVTCAATAIAKGFVGQPEWHPDGLRIILQVESENADHTTYSHLSWGVDNDLYLIDADGTDATKIFDTPDTDATLHPQINAAGDLIVWAKRDVTGETGHGGPFDENEWDGWSIRVCDFDDEQSGTSKIANCADIQPNGEGFYEPAGLTSDDRIVYSFGSGDLPAGIYACDRDGSDVETISATGQWFEEFGVPSPVNDAIVAFASSRVVPAVVYPPATCCASLRMELFVTNGSTVRQMTFQNAGFNFGVRRVVSDFDWNRDGTVLVFQDAPFVTGARPQIWKVAYP